MECEAQSRIEVAERVTRAIAELKALQDPLLSGVVDPQTLTDFRDALNRVRNVAWAVQQSSAPVERGATDVASILASERIRAAYQLCLLIRSDVRRDDIEFQKGNLLELHEVTTALVSELKTRI